MEERSVGQEGIQSPLTHILIMKTLSIQKKIRTVFLEDQKDRSSIKLTKFSDIERWKIIGARDKARREVIEEILEIKPKLTGLDCFRIGIIFQHGGTVGDIKKAQRFAKQGFILGSKPSKWLYAAATDRLLMMKGKPQKFGTQYRKNKEGIWEVHPIQPDTTDTERKAFNVSPLQKILKNVESLNKKGRFPRSKRIGLTRKK